MIIFNILLFLSVIINQCFAKVTINLVNYEYRLLNDLFNTLANDFNVYAKENDIDAEIKITTYTIANCSIEVNNYGSILEHLLLKGSQKYDVIIYDNMYSKRFSPYFEDLRNWLPEDHLANYTSGIASKTCMVDDKIVGLPLCVDYSLIYSNSKLLDKYHMETPKTWEELLEIGNYIKEKEKEEGNDIIGYNGLFALTEAAMCSFTEFLYSFRETVDSPCPSYSSPEAVEALNTLKRIKNELSSDSIFQGTEYNAIMSLIQGEMLFVKYWNMKDVNEIWKRGVLVGKHEGVSGSSVGLYNIGLNRFIKEERKSIAAEVIKFITSWEIQKKYILLTYSMYSGLSALYDDEEVCQNYDCELAKNIQFIARPSLETDNYDDYSNEYRSYLYEFLYDDRTAEDTLQRIIDINKIYDITISPSESYEGFIIFVLFVIVAILILASFPLLFMKKYSPYFGFFTLDSWVAIFIGLLITLSFVITDYGSDTVIYCNIKDILLSVGYTFIYVPLLHQLIFNLPKTNQALSWIKHHKWLFFLCFVLFDVLVNCISILLEIYEVKEIVVKDGKNFKSCRVKSTKNSNNNIVILVIIVTEKALLALLVGFLTFLEWNVLKTKRDVRLITAALYSNILLNTMLIISLSVDIKSYILFVVIRNILVILLVLSHYAFLFILRIIAIVLNKHQSGMLPDVRATTKRDSSNNMLKSSMNDSKSRSTNMYNSSNFVTGILELHYYTGEDPTFGSKSVTEISKSEPYAQSNITSKITSNIASNIASEKSSSDV